jgi:hypothetical protein
VHAAKYQNFKTDLAEGVGEVAGVLWRVAKYAYEKVRVCQQRVVDGGWGGGGICTADEGVLIILVEVAE